MTTPHCLVIEDDAETCDYLCSGLRAAGYTVVAAGNGTDGTRHLRERRWDIVVLDRMLPGHVDGIGLLEQMRARGDRHQQQDRQPQPRVGESVHGVAVSGARVACQ